MAQAPVMPLYTDALIGDTTHLSPREFGAYMRVLIATWRNNGQPFPDNDKILGRISGMATYEFRTQMRPVLTPFFDLSDGSWRQKRLELEWSRCSARRASAIACGSMGGRPKKAKPLETKETEKARGYSQLKLNESYEKPILNLNQEEDSVSPGGDTGGGSAPPMPPDPVKELWDRGLAILGSKHRSLLGKMAKSYGPVTVLAAIVETENEMPVNPPAFFIACCERRKVNGRHGNADERHQRDLGDFADWARQRDEREGIRGSDEAAH